MHSKRCVFIVRMLKAFIYSFLPAVAASVPVDPTSSSDPNPTTEGACSLPVASQQDGGEHVNHTVSLNVSHGGMYV